MSANLLSKALTVIATAKDIIDEVKKDLAENFEAHRDQYSAPKTDGDNVAGQIVVNGVVYRGNNISVSGDKIVIDGKDVSKSHGYGPVKVEIAGSVNVVETGAGDITVTGTARDIQTGAGDVSVGGSVHGNVVTGSGDINVGGNVGGNATTSSGDITYHGH